MGDVTISPASSSTTRPPASKSGAADFVNADGFLQILIAQLTSQDPLAPTDSSQMLSQFASITQVQKSAELAAEFKKFSQNESLLSSLSLVGREVRLNHSNEPFKVSAVYQQSGNLLLEGAGGQIFHLQDVAKIQE